MSLHLATSTTPHRPAPPVTGRGRTQHLLDIENLVLGRVTPGSVRRAWAAYNDIVGIHPGDQVRVACAATTAAQVAFAIPAAVQLIVGGRGRNAADKALIDSIDPAFTARRFAAVIIGSADHAFAPVAAALASQGCEVHAASRTRCATALILATTTQHQLIYLGSR